MTQGGNCTANSRPAILLVSDPDGVQGAVCARARATLDGVLGGVIDAATKLPVARPGGPGVSWRLPVHGVATLEGVPGAGIALAPV